MNAQTTSQPDTVTVVDHDTVNFIGQRWADRVRRVSWGAILAGFVSAAALQLLLSVLGLAIGLWSIDPLTEANPVAGLGTGSGIYLLITGVLSLFVGGCVAGYMCGVPDLWDGGLHGMVIWGLVTLTSFWYVGSTFGTLFSATTSALGNGLAIAADWSVPDQIATSTAANSDSSRQERTTFALPAVNYERMANELNEILQETGKDDLQPEQLRAAGKRLQKVSLDAAQTVAKNPDSMNHQIDRVVGAFFEEWQPIKADLDRDAATKVLAANTELSEEKAAKTVDRWSDEYEEAKQAADQAQEEMSEELAELEQAATEQYQEIKHVTLKTTDDVLDTVAAAAMWSFFAMLLGLLSAVGGGILGVEEVPRRFASLKS